MHSPGMEKKRRPNTGMVHVGSSGDRRKLMAQRTLSFKRSHQNAGESSNSKPVEVRKILRRHETMQDQARPSNSDLVDYGLGKNGAPRAQKRQRI